MPLPKLNLEVPQEGYSFDDGDSVLTVKLSSGVSRSRLDQLDAPLTGQMSLVLNPVQYQYWRAFYRTAIVHGALPFLMDLVIDSSDIEEREVKIIGTAQTSIKGTAHIIQFPVEVASLENSAFDNDLILLFGIYGDQVPLILNGLAKLVNVDLPEIVA